jgi:hypothetical protein
LGRRERRGNETKSRFGLVEEKTAAIICIILENQRRQNNTAKGIGHGTVSDVVES